MLSEIVAILPSRLDENCLEITLRHKPGLIQRILGHKDSFCKYKGHGNHWYSYPSFNPASKKIARFLKSIGQHPEYRHLQIAIRKQKRQN